MKDNLYKFLKFLNRNKYIAVIFVFALSFFVFKNSAFAASCNLGNIKGCFDQVVGGIFISIALFFINFASYIFGLAFPIFLNITGSIINSGPINTAWILVRDLVNMFFIFFLLFTSLAKLVGQEKKLAQHSASKQIVYILLSAFLINFSKVICGVVVDVAQIVTLQFTNAFVDSLQHLNTLFSTGTGTEPSILLGIVFIIFALAFLATALTSLLYILIRSVSLGIYAALSPLWFLWLSFPTKSKGIQQIKTETMDKFFEAAIGGPILAFYLWISLMLINTGTDGSLTDSVGQAGDGTKLSAYIKENSGTSTDEDISSNSADTSMADVLKMVVASAVLLFANKQAMSMAKKGGTVMGKGLMDGVVNKVGDVGMKPLDGLKNMGEKAFKGAGNLASKPFRSAGDMAQSGMYNAANTLKGGALNGINKLRNKPSGFGAGLNSVMEFGENLQGNAKKRADFVVAEKKLRKDAASGNPEAKAKLIQHQKEKGNLVATQIRQDGGMSGFVGKRLKSGGKKVAGALATGVAIAAAPVSGGASLAVLGALAGGVGAKNVIFDSSSRKKQMAARAEIAKLEEEKKIKMNDKTRYTKEDVNLVDKKIQEQKDLIARERAKATNESFRKSNASNIDSLNKELERLDPSRKANRLAQENSGIDEELKDLVSLLETDPNSGMVKAKIKAKEDERRKNEKIIEKLNKKSRNDNPDDQDRIKELEALINGPQKTKDDVLRQENAVAKAKKAFAKAGENVEKAYLESAGIKDSKEVSTSLKRFNDEISNIESSLIDSVTGKLKNDANIDFTTMVRKVEGKNGESKVSVRGNENEFLASLAFALKNGLNIDDRQKALINNSGIQSEVGNFVNSGRVEKDLKEAWNKIVDSNKSNINLPSARIRTEENDEKERKEILDIASGDVSSIGEQSPVVSAGVNAINNNGNTSGTEGTHEVQNNEYIKAREELTRMEDEMTDPRTSKADTQAYEELMAEVNKKIADIQTPTVNSPIEVSQDSFGSISRTIKGAIKDLDSSLSAKFDQLIDSLSEGSLSGSSVSEVGLSRDTIGSFASELRSATTPEQYNSLINSLNNNISNLEGGAKTAIGEITKILQQQASTQEAKDRQQEADNIRKTGSVGLNKDDNGLS